VRDTVKVLGETDERGVSEEGEGRASGGEATHLVRELLEPDPTGLVNLSDLLGMAEEAVDSPYQMRTSAKRQSQRDPARRRSSYWTRPEGKLGTHTCS
jgi:hypothetical protein